jgi:hypothetical protein
MDGVGHDWEYVMVIEGSRANVDIPVAEGVSRYQMACWYPREHGKPISLPKVDVARLRKTLQPSTRQPTWVKRKLWLPSWHSTEAHTSFLHKGKLSRNH